MVAPIAERLLAACNGYPSAPIKWPHRLLHEAVEALNASKAALNLVKDAIPTNPLHALTTYEIPHATFIACGTARLILEGVPAKAEGAQ